MIQDFLSYGYFPSVQALKERDPLMLLEKQVLSGVISWLMIM